MQCRSIFGCEYKEKRWSNIKGINERHWFAFRKSRGGIPASSRDCLWGLFSAAPTTLSALVFTVKDPDLAPHTCMVLGENRKKWTGASGLWLPGPHPPSCRREEEIKAPWTNSKAHYSKLPMFMDSLTHPRGQLWAPGANSSEWKAINLCSPSSLAVAIYLERYNSKHGDWGSPARRLPHPAKSIPDQEKSFCSTAGLQHG